MTWKSATQPPTTRFDFGPYFTSTGGSLLMAGTTAGKTTVWSSSDGLGWSLVSQDGAFDMAGRRFVAQGMSDDGQGGLVIVGDGVGSTATDVTATVWRSHDGRAWNQAQVAAAQGQEMIGGVVARDGALVRRQRHRLVLVERRQLDPVGVPAAQAFIPRAVGAFDGGFVIVALANGSSGVRSAVWYSADGRA